MSFHRTLDLSLSLSASEPRCGGFSRFCNFIYFLSNFHYLYISRDLKHLKFLWTWMFFPSRTRIAKWTFLFRRGHEFFYEDTCKTSQKIFRAKIWNGETKYSQKYPLLIASCRGDKIKSHPQLQRKKSNKICFKD